MERIIRFRIVDGVLLLDTPQETLTFVIEEEGIESLQQCAADQVFVTEEEQEHDRHLRRFYAAAEKLDPTADNYGDGLEKALRELSEAIYGPADKAVVRLTEKFFEMEKARTDKIGRGDL